MILFTFTIAIVFAGCILWFISKKITAPLREMNDIARLYAKGDFSKSVHVNSNDEIGQLANSFTYMAKELNQLENTRKQFISNVSHELRSPLTSIKGFIIALMDGTIPSNKRAMGSHVAVVLKEGNKDDSEKLDVSILGIEPGSFLEPSVVEGKPLTEGDNYQVTVNSSLKDKGIELGDILEIEGFDETLEVIGFVEGETFNHLPSIFIDLEPWRSIHFAAPGSDMGVESPVNAIMLQGDTIDTEKLANSIDGIEIATKKEAINGLPGYTAENGTIMMMLGFLLVISAFVIGVFFYVLTLQKANQFGVMKAIGASNGFLAKAIISQITLLATISIGIGIIFTYGTAAILPPGMPFALDSSLVFSYAIILLVVSVLSSLISVRRITKIDPLQAIGRVE
ncbi:FtsX-like permease family protein [Ureibacillus manganicus]|uniref:FtsX-like permease family protein n=1 Tax=Ureibacillus manganicus TaxID=1266064 RepID=UPI000AF0C760|nr:ABC transporter permease [Ureibacillus manganicus]